MLNDWPFFFATCFRRICYCRVLICGLPTLSVPCGRCGIPRIPPHFAAPTTSRKRSTSCRYRKSSARVPSAGTCACSSWVRRTNRMDRLIRYREAGTAFISGQDLSGEILACCFGPTSEFGYKRTMTIRTSSIMSGMMTQVDILTGKKICARCKKTKVIGEVSHD